MHGEEGKQAEFREIQRHARECETGKVEFEEFGWVESLSDDDEVFDVRATAQEQHEWIFFFFFFCDGRRRRQGRDVAETF